MKKGNYISILLSLLISFVCVFVFVIYNAYKEEMYSCMVSVIPNLVLLLIKGTVYCLKKEMSRKKFIAELIGLAGSALLYLPFLFHDMWYNGNTLMLNYIIYTQVYVGIFFLYCFIKTKKLTYILQMLLAFICFGSSFFVNVHFATKLVCYAIVIANCVILLIKAFKNIKFSWKTIIYLVAGIAYFVITHFFISCKLDSYIKNTLYLLIITVICIIIYLCAKKYIKKEELVIMVLSYLLLVISYDIVISIKFALLAIPHYNFYIILFNIIILCIFSLCNYGLTRKEN